MVQNRKRAIWSNKDLPVLDTDIDKVELQLDFHFPEYFHWWQTMLRILPVLDNHQVAIA